MNRKLFSASIVAMVFLVSMQTVRAASIELQDQASNIPLSPTSRNYYNVDAAWDIAQTFTVGITGELTRVDLDVYRKVDTSQDLLVEIRRTVSGLPVADDSSILGTAALPASAISSDSFPSEIQWTSVNIGSLGIQVQAGDQLAIVLRNNAPEDHGYGWRVDYTNLYSGGQQCQRRVGDIWYSFPSNDASFRTYVTVPEPSSIILLGIGAVGLFARSRRRGRKAG